MGDERGRRHCDNIGRVRRGAVNHTLSAPIALKRLHRQLRSLRGLLPRGAGLQMTRPARAPPLQPHYGAFITRLGGGLHPVRLAVPENRRRPGERSGENNTKRLQRQDSSAPAASAGGVVKGRRSRGRTLTKTTGRLPSYAYSILPTRGSSRWRLGRDTSCLLAVVTVSRNDGIPLHCFYRENGDPRSIRAADCDPADQVTFPGRQRRALPLRGGPSGFARSDAPDGRPCTRRGHRPIAVDLSPARPMTSAYGFRSPRARR